MNDDACAVGVIIAGSCNVFNPQAAANASPSTSSTKHRHSGASRNPDAQRLHHFFRIPASAGIETDRRERAVTTILEFPNKSITFTTECPLRNRRGSLETCLGLSTGL